MDKNILYKIINFVKQPHIKEAIQNNEFSYIYERLYYEITNLLSTSLTCFFLDAKIDPLYYMSEIPSSYFNCDSTFNPPQDSGKYVKNLTIPSNIETINNGAFAHSDVENLTLAEGVGIIRESAFYGCGKLKEIYLPSTLTFIGNYAFYALNYTPLVIEYNGTVDQFKHVTKGAFWWDGFGNITVECTDGQYIE